MNSPTWWAALDSIGFDTMRALLSLLWQSSILLGAVAILSRLLHRQRASVRRALWVVALLAVPLLPGLAWLGSRVGAPQTPIPVAPTYSAPRPEAPVAPAVEPFEPAPPTAVPIADLSQPSLAAYPWALALLVYLSGAALLLFLVALWRRHMERWLRTGTVVTDARVLTAFQEARRRLQLWRDCVLLESNDIEAPLTVGTVHPVVLLPRGLARRLSDAELRAVAFHELAHVRRCDALVLELASLVRAVLFFQPLVWLAYRQISLSAEQAADDEVIQATGAPIAYARMLARLAEGLRRPAFSIQLAAGILFSESAFLRRVKAILSDRRDQIRKLSRVGLLVTAAAFVASLALAGGLPLSESSRGAALSSAITGSEAGGQVRSYDVSIPDEWKGMLSVGKLSFIGSPFYGIPWDLGLFPVVHVNLPLKNLTSDTLYVKVNYRTESTQKGYGNSGMGVYYTLGPGQERVIDTIAPIASVKRPIRFLLRMMEPHHGPPLRKPAARQVVVAIDPLPVSEPQLAAGNVQLTEGTSEHFAVKDVRLAHSEEEGNVFLAQVLNKTRKDLPLGIYVAVNDPRNTEERVSPIAMERGSFSKKVATVPAKSKAAIRVPYDIMDVGAKPLLVFTLFEPREEYATYYEHDHRRWDVRLVCWGSVDLRQAAERGDSVIPVFVPVEERAKLTAETKSEHCVFYYRPRSYAEQHLAKIVEQRERAYKFLSTTLNMELPKRVRIDLYPDMEAKGLGSGTKWTPTNTVSNFHIAEVYNQTMQTDPYHELAHIFSYQFPGASVRGAHALVEGFAAWSERGGEHEHSIKSARDALAGGTLPAMTEILLAEYTSMPIFSLVDFLVKKDVERFKKFYVHVTSKPTAEDVKNAAKEVYGKSLGKLEEEWHEYLKTARP